MSHFDMLAVRDMTDVAAVTLQLYRALSLTPCWCTHAYTPSEPKVVARCSRCAALLAYDEAMASKSGAVDTSIAPTLRRMSDRLDQVNSDVREVVRASHRSLNLKINADGSPTPAR